MNNDIDQLTAKLKIAADAAWKRSAELAKDADNGSITADEYLIALKEAQDSSTRYQIIMETYYGRRE